MNAEGDGVVNGSGLRYLSLQGFLLSLCLNVTHKYRVLYRKVRGTRTKGLEACGERGAVKLFEVVRLQEYLVHQAIIEEIKTVIKVLIIARDSISSVCSISTGQNAPLY